MSTVSTVSNATYSMWDRIPREDGLGPKASDAFKLTETRVPQSTGEVVALPMARIFQGAVQFDQDLRERQLAEALKKKDDQQDLTTAPGLTAAQTEASRAANPRAEASPSGLAPAANRRTRFAQNSSRSEAQAPAWGYRAQGRWAKAVSSTSNRLGSVLDVTA
jgi:hypothetical protein